MFYSNQILARKGPLGLVWIAAHLDRQLKRQQINSTSIPASVDTLLDSEVPLALRLSGQLLLGVVRIYARKVNYLQQDCNDALVKIRVALRPADGVNLPPGAITAPVEQITLLAPGLRAGGRNRKAAAAAAAAAGGRDGAANGDDAFVIDMDDFYWDQDVLLGQGGGGFAGFDVSGGLDLGLTPTNSGPLSQDISGVFGMHSSTGDQEVFALEDEEAAALWDLDELEVERLRAAGSQQLNSSGVSGLLGLTPGVEGPHGKGAAAAAGSPDDSDVGMHPAGNLHDDLASPAAAAVAAAGVDAGPTPMGGIDFRQDSDAAADLPPTPADGLLSPELEDTAAAAEGGYTGGAEAVAGRTPGSARKGLDLAPAGEDETAAAADVDLMDVDGAAAAAAMDDAQQQQGGDEAEGNDVAAAATPTKTFQRRKASQQQQNQDKETAAAAEASATAAAAAKAARQRRSAALLGHKKKVIVDDHADGAAIGQHHPTTELPAAEIRALLADRSSLMDKTRGQSLLGKRPYPEPDQAPTAAPTPAELLQLQLAPAAAAGNSVDAPAALQVLLNGNGLASAATGGSSRAVLGPHSSFGGAIGVLGGLGGAASLPAQIRQLFVQAAQAAASRGGAAAVAPTADLDQIDMAEDGEDAAALGLGGGLAGSAGAINLRGGVTRNSLSLSLSTPGSAAAAAAGTPATAAGPQQQEEGLPSAGGLPSDPRTGRSGFGLTPGAAGFEGGYTPGTVGAAAAGQQQLPPDGDEDQILPDNEMMMDGGLGVLDHYHHEFEPQDSEARPHDDLVPWPADDETLMEQPADGTDPADVNDGGFTSRTRLVMKHLQHAAAAAAGPSAAATPASGGSSRRRISAAPPPSLAAAGGKDLEQQGSVASPLSFKTLTQGHNRLDACRWFYEVLVLGNKGLVTVKQDEPYGDVAVTPNLAAMARI